MKRNKGSIFIPIIALIVVLCLGYYIISLTYSMAEARGRFEQTLNNRRAYFMARSGIEHTVLKFDTLQRYNKEAINTLVESKGEDRQITYLAFTKDILLPPDDSHTGEKFGYNIDEFDLKDANISSSTFLIELKSIGRYGRYRNNIKRLIYLSL